MPDETPLHILPVDQRIPDVPTYATRDGGMPSLTDDMREARESYERRWKAYRPLRQEQFRLKEEKTAHESELNTQFAAEQRQAFDR